MKGNLRYRISEKTTHDIDVNIDALIHNVELLYKKKCSDNKYSCSDNDSEQDMVDTQEQVQEQEQEAVQEQIQEQVMDLSLDANTQSEILATRLHYETNINRDKLEQIANYYKISHRKKKKIDLAKDLAIFEHDASNIQIVNKRKKLWKNIKELKEDEFFKQYITFNI